MIYLYSLYMTYFSKQLLWLSVSLIAILCLSCSTSNDMNNSTNIADNASINSQVTTTDIIHSTEAQNEKDADTNSDRVTLEIGDGSTARYIVREQLASLTMPNDAIGKTDNVTGSLTFDSSGKIIEGAEIKVDLRSLVSDKTRRDNYIKNKTLQTDTFPYATFKPKETKDIPWPIPSQGEASFTIIGDLTIKGVTKKVTWTASSIFSPQELQTDAKLIINFDDFGIVKPRLAFIVSVEDEIAIELYIKSNLGVS